MPRKAAKPAPKAKAADPKPKSTRGGRRPGSGRKPASTAELRSKLAAAVDQVIADEAIQLVRNLIFLANGGYERVEHEYEPEISISIAPTSKRKPAKPAPPRLVLTKRKVSVAEPDRAANFYLLDRLLGRAKQALELGGPGGGPIPVAIEDAIERIYGKER